ncbi:MAG: trigger factor [Schwartzia sp.]|nr:trigger factor [Schwartzia sp. (in: firmicutes)]
MKVTKENGDNQQVVLTIEVEQADWSKAIGQAVKRIANKVDIHGFRRGKAPRQVIEREIGKEAILDEAFEKIGQKAFNEALEQEKIELASYPSFERVTVEEDKPLVFKATVTPKPEVTLGEYKGLKVESKLEPVTDETVAEHIDRMRERKAKLTEAPEGSEVKKGDLVTLDFKGFVDGEAFENGEGKDYPLTIGSGSFIPGFEDQLIGAKAGEDREVKVTFPADYHEKKLSGKDATFQCKIHTIKHKELPELTDDFVESVSVFHTVDELKKDVREKLEKAAENKAENERRAAAIEKAAENITVDIPPVMIDDRVEQMIEEMAMRLEQQGLKFEQYMQYAGSDIEQLRAEYRETAEKNVRTDLMLEAVARAEDIKVETADLDAEVATMAQLYGAQPAQVKKIITSQGRIGDLAVTVLRRKTAKFIVDNLAE